MTTTPKQAAAEAHEADLHDRQRRFKKLCDTVRDTCSWQLGTELAAEGLQMTRAARRWAAAVARERQDRQLRMVAAWMWNAHLARHRRCHTRMHTRRDYHPDPILCGCFQDEQPSIRQVLARGREARQAGQ